MRAVAPSNISSVSRFARENLVVASSGGYTSHSTIRHSEKGQGNTAWHEGTTRGQVQQQHGICAAHWLRNETETMREDRR